MVKTYPADVPLGNKLVNAEPVVTAPVPPCVIAKGLVNVKPLNVGEADVLKSCDVATVKVFPEPVIVTPLVLVSVIPPVFGVAEPDVPVNVLADVFARAYDEVT